MSLKFYYHPMSPPSRAAWITLEEMGLKYSKNIVNIMEGEQKKDEFKKINPRQKVPALVDGDFRIAESRAIATYLANKYGAKQGKQSLYPTDACKRGTVDQHLYISENTVEQVLSYVNMGGVLFGGGDKRDENLCKAKEAAQTVEELLQKTKYTAGDEFTLADIFYYMALGFLDVVDFDWSGYPKISQWRAGIAARPWYDEVWAKPQSDITKMYKAKRGTKDSA